MAANRRALWGGAILIVAIVAVMVVGSGNDTSPRAASSRARAGGREAPAEETPPAAEVNLEILARARSEPMDLGRNPFRFRPKPPPPAPPAPPAAKLPDDQLGTAMAPAVPAGPPPPPPITLKFIGLVQKADGTRIAVLSDGKRPISGREGEEIEGRYKILKIGNESIEIAYIDGRGRQTIRLTGQ